MLLLIKYTSCSNGVIYSLFKGPFSLMKDTENQQTPPLFMGHHIEGAEGPGLCCSGLWNASSRAAKDLWVGPGSVYESAQAGCRCQSECDDLRLIRSIMNTHTHTGAAYKHSNCYQRTFQRITGLCGVQMPGKRVGDRTGRKGNKEDPFNMKHCLHLHFTWHQKWKWTINKVRTIVLTSKVIYYNQSIF